MPLTLPAASVKALIADGDTRWINRGAYDLLGAGSEAPSVERRPARAPALYGPLPEQLQRAPSFASQLRNMLGSARSTASTRASRSTSRR